MDFAKLLSEVNPSEAESREYMPGVKLHEGSRRNSLDGRKAWSGDRKKYLSVILKYLNDILKWLSENSRLLATDKNNHSLHGLDWP